jgi:hypothetical protein
MNATAEQTAIIRPYDHDQDHKLFLFYVGKQFLEPLAIANRAGERIPSLRSYEVAHALHSNNEPVDARNLDRSIVDIRTIL